MPLWSLQRHTDRFYANACLKSVDELKQGGPRGEANAQVIFLDRSEVNPLGPLDETEHDGEVILRGVLCSRRS